MERESDNECQDMKKWTRLFIVLWMKYTRSQNVPTTSQIHKEKVLQISKELGGMNLVQVKDGYRDLNQGMIYRIKKNCKEAANVDVDLVNQ